MPWTLDSEYLFRTWPNFFKFRIDTQKFKLVPKFTLLLRLEIVNLALVLAGHCDFFGHNFISLDRNAL